MPKVLKAEEGEPGQMGVETQSGALTARREVVVSVGKARVTKWRLLLHQIGVDVLRADRALQFFEDEGNRYRLMETLACYAWYDSEVGYCQGENAGSTPVMERS